MARNKYPGVCYRCGKPVKPKDGHFELIPRSRRIPDGPKWRMQHADCAIKYFQTDVDVFRKRPAARGEEE